MGIIQYWNIFMYTMRIGSSQHRCTYIESEAFKNGSMGRQRNWSYERGWQLQSTPEIWTTCTRLLSTTHRKWSTVSTTSVMHSMFMIRLCWMHMQGDCMVFRYVKSPELLNQNTNSAYWIRFFEPNILQNEDVYTDAYSKNTFRTATDSVEIQRLVQHISKIC